MHIHSHTRARTHKHTHTHTFTHTYTNTYTNLAIVGHHAGRRGVAGPEAQQPRRRVRHVVKNPVLEGVVRARAHEERLAREKVEAHLRSRAGGGGGA